MIKLAPQTKLASLSFQEVLGKHTEQKEIVISNTQMYLDKEKAEK